MYAIIGITSHQLTRILGLVVVALVAAIPLISLASDTHTFMTPEGMTALSNPYVLQMLLFGTTYAAVGETMTSLALSFVLMELLRRIFTGDGGAIGTRYFKEDTVRFVQKNIFSYTSTDESQ